MNITSPFLQFCSLSIVLLSLWWLKMKAQLLFHNVSITSQEQVSFDDIDPCNLNIDLVTICLTK